MQPCLYFGHAIDILLDNAICIDMVMFTEELLIIASVISSDADIEFDARLILFHHQSAKVICPQGLLSITYHARLSGCLDQGIFCPFTKDTI